MNAFDRQASDTHKAGERELFRGHGIFKFVLPIVLGISAFVLGVAGWMFSPSFDGTFKSFSDVIVRVVGTFLLNDSQTKDVGNWATQLGKILAALTTASGAILIAVAAAREAITGISTRYLLSSHTLVLGDTSIARHIAEDFRRSGHRVVQVVPPEAPKVLPFGVARVRMGFENAAILKSVAAHHARFVFIDTGSVAQTLGLGRTLMDRVHAEPTAPSLLRRIRRQTRTQPDRLMLHVSDTLLAREFADFVSTEVREKSDDKRTRIRPTIFDENWLIARQTLGRYPLFKIAAARGQPRVHAVIVGFGGLAEQLVDQVMLTSIAGTLGVPRVTILDRNARIYEQEFRVRRPAVLDTLDISFVEFDIGADLDSSAHPPGQIEGLLASEKTDGLTAIFVTHPSDDSVLRTVMQLRRWREHLGIFNASIYYATNSEEAAFNILGEPSGDEARPDRFIRMQSPSEVISKAIFASESIDRLAQVLHESYLKNRSGLGDGVSWQDLPETLRRANIRACDHIPAKLWTLGCDDTGLDDAGMPILLSTSRDNLLTLIAADRSAHSLDLLRKLGSLEHERWMVDRKLDGWRYGAERDDQRLLHPLIVPASQLQKSPDEIAKDLELVLTVLRFVAKS